MARHIIPKTSFREMRDLEHSLKRRLKGDVRFDIHSRVLYSTDASIYQMMPIGVVVPRTREDVLATIEMAHERNVPILPRGAGTSQAGQAVNNALVIDFTRYLDKVLEVNTEERWARVEPGVVIDRLNKQLRQHGLWFPIDPSTANRATIGGSIGNNAAGGHSILYGMTDSQVHEVKVALYDATETTFAPLSSKDLQAWFAGDDLEAHIYREVWRTANENRDEIDRRFPKVSRNSGGYALDKLLGNGPFNMTKLVVGSEGTLCVVTEAKVNLEPLPRKRATTVVHFRDLFRAMDATPYILRHNPSSVELMDGTLIQMTRQSPGYARRLSFLEGDPGAILSVEFYGESEEQLKDKVESLEHDLKGRGMAYACVHMMTAAEQANLAAVRSANFGLLASVRGDAKAIPFVEDTAVAPQRLSEFVRQFDQVIRDNGASAGYYGHASVGCLHIRPFINLKTADGIKQMLSIAKAICDLVMFHGGAFSGEHGDGIARGAWTEKFYGPRLYEAFRRIKRAFDPSGIMNPGKIIDTPPMDSNLRFGPKYRTQTMNTVMDFSADHGYAGAVEMCSGVGACHKLGEGFMCPSFMVTREEQHSTRGRATLLRAALSGLLPPEELTGERLYEALDLCLACKSCKSECPASVDMAKLKYEFLHNYYKVHGVPFRQRMFGHVETVNKWGSRLAPLSNWALMAPPVRWVMHSFPGIHYKAKLPVFARQTFRKWFARHKPAGDGSKGKVAYFNDIFTNYNHPSFAIATVEVLEKAGFEVVLADCGQSGRPLISKGFLDEARDLAIRNVASLHRYVEQGVPIVGCEPSALLTFRDEYPDLVPGDQAKEVARNSYLVEEFLQMLADSNRLDLKFKAEKRKLLFHAHTFQRALVGTGPALKVLRLPGHDVKEMNGGDCGMAGAFGYETEHYDIAQSIFKQCVLPEMQAEPDRDLVIAGVSCYQMLSQHTHKPVRHLIEVFRDSIV